jgi:hypothetical protein
MARVNIHPSARPANGVASSSPAEGERNGPRNSQETKSVHYTA